MKNDHSVTEQALFAGFGGQGVLSMGKMLAESAIAEGLHVTWLPSYGAEMRGGTANVSVIISGQKIGSPYIFAGEATSIVAMNLPSLLKYESLLKPGGFLFINSSIIDVKAKRKDVTAFYIPVNDIAEKLGNTKIANMVMLGAYLKVTGIVSSDTLIRKIAEVFGEKKADLVPLNQAGIEEGARCVNL